MWINLKTTGGIVPFQHVVFGLLATCPAILWHFANRTKKWFYDEIFLVTEKNSSMTLLDVLSQEVYLDMRSTTNWNSSLKFLCNEFSLYKNWYIRRAHGQEWPATWDDLIKSILSLIQQFICSKLICLLSDLYFINVDNIQSWLIK